MQRIDTVIIGAGQAGLALSRSLVDRGIEHVVLERGRIAERWRSERWDSLRLLTPRWQTRLPGHRYDGDDPDGYMTKAELVAYLERYAALSAAPVHAGVTVTDVSRGFESLRVRTDQDDWSADQVVIATGDAQAASVPTLASRLSPDIHQVAPTRYKNPEQLPPGGVLVVGASATGVQLAAEIHASGRPVILSVGRHTRMPRTYRGRDTLWWLDRMGIFDERADAVRDLSASRSQPSLQLVGRADRSTLDLGVLMDAGVRLVGRTREADGHTLRFCDDLVESVAAADIKLARLRARIDAFIASDGLSPAGGKPTGGHAGSHSNDTLEQPEPFSFLEVNEGPERIDLRSEGIETVVWATGYRRSYPWLNLPVLDRAGEIVHRGGITAERGLYAMGLKFMRRRNSSFIDGQAQDAVEIADHIQALREAPYHAMA